MKIELHLDEDTYRELQYLVDLQQRYRDSVPMAQGSVADLLVYLAAAMADGSRRPGAWERQILEMTGQLPQCGELAHYRAAYGDPANQIGEVKWSTLK